MATQPCFAFEEGVYSPSPSQNVDIFDSFGAAVRADLTKEWFREASRSKSSKVLETFFKAQFVDNFRNLTKLSVTCDWPRRCRHSFYRKFLSTPDCKLLDLRVDLFFESDALDFVSAVDRMEGAFRLRSLTIVVPQFWHVRVPAERMGEALAKLLNLRRLEFRRIRKENRKFPDLDILRALCSKAGQSCKIERLVVREATLGCQDFSLLQKLTSLRVVEFQTISQRTELALPT